MKVLFFVGLLACLCLNVEAYSSGAPTTGCDHMTPGHGYEPQPFPAPYTLTATPIDSARYNVTLEADSGFFFQGFLIQARSNVTHTAVGSFENSPISWTVNCFDVPKSGSTHFNTLDKTVLNVIWNSPQSGEDIYFLATVAREFSTFWVKIPGTIV